MKKQRKTRAQKIKSAERVAKAQREYATILQQKTELKQLKLDLIEAKEKNLQAEILWKIAQLSPFLAMCGVSALIANSECEIPCEKVSKEIATTESPLTTKENPVGWTLKYLEDKKEYTSDWKSTDDLGKYSYRLIIEVPNEPSYEDTKEVFVELGVEGLLKDNQKITKHIPLDSIEEALDEINVTEEGRKNILAALSVVAGIALSFLVKPWQGYIESQINVDEKNARIRKLERNLFKPKRR